MPDAPSDDGHRPAGRAVPVVRTRDAVVIALLVVVCGTAITSRGETDSAASHGDGVPAAAHTSIIATARGDRIAVYRKPGGNPRFYMSNPTPVGSDRVFLVEGSNGDGWLRVLLPIRPNGSKAWIRSDDATLSKTTYRIHVYLADHRIVVKHDAGDVTIKGPIGVGTKRTPTPDGEYYIVSLLKTPKENSPYGPYAFGLSGFSSVLKSFAGGPGRIGLHGTNRPELLGQDVSHGCIRMSNDDITKLANTLPLGTPVYVHA